MNNYKFRGKTANSWPGEWVYGFLVKDYRQSYIYNGDNGDFSDCGGVPIDDLYSVRPETVGQWTGLLDKNGKEIYEGDYLKDIGLVSFDKGAIFAGKVLLYNFSIEELEVISNPELMEDK